MILYNILKIDRIIKLLGFDQVLMIGAESTRKIRYFNFNFNFIMNIKVLVYIYFGEKTSFRALLSCGIITVGFFLGVQEEKKISKTDII